MRKKDGINVTNKMRNRINGECKRTGLRKSIELAEACNMTPQSLSRIINGKRPIYPETLEALSDIFGVSVDYLLGKTDYRTETMERADRGWRERSREDVDNSILSPLLRAAGYELEGAYLSKWAEPRSVADVLREDMEYYGQEKYAEDGEPIDPRPEALRKVMGAIIFSDTSCVYRFRIPGGRVVYVPAENFFVVEKLIEDFAKATFQNLFADWSGKEAVTKAPPEEWRLPDFSMEEEAD